MTNWKYQVLEWKGKDPEELQVLLDAEGDLGWEAFSIDKQNKDYTVLFRRRNG